jgi:hypothetical protein
MHVALAHPMRTNILKSLMHQLPPHQPTQCALIILELCLLRVLQACKVVAGWSHMSYATAKTLQSELSFKIF